MTPELERFIERIKALPRYNCKEWSTKAKHFIQLGQEADGTYYLVDDLNRLIREADRSETKEKR